MAKTQTYHCPYCGHETMQYRNPVPTVDIIIEYGQGIVIIERKNPPFGWALPGGFVDYGETVEHAAAREAREETGLEVQGLRMFHVYSNPNRDPRQHTITTVFVGKGTGTLEASDDAKASLIVKQDTLPEAIAFDHAKILEDYFAWKAGDTTKGMICT